MSIKIVLKRDLFGEVWKTKKHGEAVVLRDARSARWWLAWLARSLLKRAAKALAVLQDIRGIPQLINCARTRSRSMRIRYTRAA